MFVNPPPKKSFFRAGPLGDSPWRWPWRWPQRWPLALAPGSGPGAGPGAGSGAGPRAPTPPPRAPFLNATHRVLCRSLKENSLLARRRAAD